MAAHGFAGDAGALEAVRRLALHIMIGNGDAHLKNWTVLHPQSGPSRLSPNYDLVCTLPYIPNDALALKLGGGKGFGLTPRRFQRMAGRLPMEPGDLCKLLRIRLRGCGRLGGTTGCIPGAGTSARRTGPAHGRHGATGGLRCKHRQRRCLSRSSRNDLCWSTVPPHDRSVRLPCLSGCV